MAKQTFNKYGLLENTRLLQKYIPNEGKEMWMIARSDNPLKAIVNTSLENKSSIPQRHSYYAL